MYYKKYEGERIYLSPMNVEDYKTYTKWMNDETLTSGLGNVATIISETNEKEFIENIGKKQVNFQFAIVSQENDELLGTYGLERPLPRDIAAQCYHIGGFIGDINKRNQGYGTEALKLVTKYAFEILNAHTIHSTILSFNQNSLKVAQKLGYNIVGEYKETYYYNGCYHNEFIVQITKSEYNNLKEKLYK